MKKILLLILISILTISCGFFEGPSFYPHERKYEYYINDDNSSNTEGNRRGNNNNNNNNGRGNRDNNNQTNTSTSNVSNNKDNEEEPYVEYNDLPSLTFDVYLYCQGKTNDTIRIVSNSKGGIVYFNLYIDNLSMSMYGFSKYDIDFYEFSNVYPYCGYSSFSLDTRYYAPYKMIVKPNNSGRKRYVHGYWAVNNGGCMYRAFHVILEQDF